jgi:GTPase SAR1 family protein
LVISAVIFLGVEISDLSIKRGPFGTFSREYTFKVWDFGGQEDYYTTHQCFLSTMSLYLLVWRLIDGEKGVAGLIPW